MRQQMAGLGEGEASARRNAGVALVFTSAMVFSTAGLFTKGVEADAWAVIFWRGLFSVVFSVIWIAWRGGLRSEFVRMGRPGLAVAVVGAFGTVAFISALKQTTIANVALIYAAAPFVAAGIAWVWMREKPTRSTVVASSLAFAGVAVIVGGSVGGINLTGDMQALFMTLMMSVLIVIYRRYPGTPAAGPMAMSSVLLLPVALWFGDSLAADPAEIPLLAAFGLVFAVASITLGAGAKRLPAPETALLSALEAPFAPIWAWLVLSEEPMAATVVGGMVILAAVFGHHATGHPGR
jgi:drug/metabolite transporter (DMT)-like permease